MEDPEQLYTLYGHYEFRAKISGGALCLKTDGPNFIKFPDGQLVQFIYPIKRVGGMLWGDRTLIHDESYIFEDK
jgi:hypothetical protein